MQIDDDNDEEEEEEEEEVEDKKMTKIRLWEVGVQKR